MSVAESIVIFGPIVHTGCCERLLHAGLRELVAGPASERAARAGEHDALEVLAPLAAHRHRERGVLGVDGQQPLRLALDEVGHELAADDEALLVRERERLARLQRRERGRQPGRADERVQHHVGLGLAREALGRVGTLDRSRPRAPRRSSASRRRRRPRRRSRRPGAGTRGSGPPSSSRFAPAADSPTTLNRSGLCRTTSSACVPTDPVEPRIVTDFMRSRLPRGSRNARNSGAAAVRDSGDDDAVQEERRRRHEQQRVDAVEHAPVARAGCCPCP